MKKYLLLLTLFCAVAVNAQLTGDDFESYSEGLLEAQADPTEWEGWWGDVTNTLVTSEQANSGSQSAKIWVGAYEGTSLEESDLVGLFGDITEGKWELKFMQYLPSNADNGDVAGAYYNLQHGYAPGTGVWACGVYMIPESEGNAYIAADGKQDEFTVIRDQWVEHKFVIDIDNDLAEFFYNDEKISEWAWSTEENGGGDNSTLNAIDFYAYCGGDFAGCTAQSYVDDISLTELESIPPLSDFNLMMPADAATVEVNSTTPETLDFSWEASVSGLGEAVTYVWNFRTEGGAQIFNLASNNTGADTDINVPISNINSVLDNLNVEVGSSANFTWKIIASAGDNELESTETRTITLTRIEEAPVEPPVSITQVTNTINLFPNPATTQINVNGSFNTVNIYSISGQLLISTSKTNIDVSTLSSGAYFVEILTDNGTLTEKLNIIR